MWHKVDGDAKYTKITAATSYYSWAKLVYIIHVLFNLNNSKKLKYIYWISLKFYILEQVLPLPTLNFRCVVSVELPHITKNQPTASLIFTLSFWFSPLKCKLFLPSSCPVSPLDCFLCCSLFFQFTSFKCTDDDFNFACSFFTRGTWVNESQTLNLKGNRYWTRINFRWVGKVFLRHFSCQNLLKLLFTQLGCNYLKISTSFPFMAMF